MWCMSEVNQQQLVKCKGIEVLAKLISETSDAKTTDIIKYILQTCINRGKEIVTSVKAFLRYWTKLLIFSHHVTLNYNVLRYSVINGILVVAYLPIQTEILICIAYCIESKEVWKWNEVQLIKKMCWKFYAVSCNRKLIYFCYGAKIWVVFEIELPLICKHMPQWQPNGKYEILVSL